MTPALQARNHRRAGDSIPRPSVTIEAGRTFSVSFNTSDGRFLASYSTIGLCRLEFPRAGHPHSAPEEVPEEAPPHVRRWHQLTVRAVQAVLDGHAPAELPPMDVSAGTDFQRRVWEQMLRIPLGSTLSYGEVARTIGKPKAVRAVGGACGANPIPVLIPCHRILAAQQRLGGFSGGLDWKRKLLAREGREFALE